MRYYLDTEFIEDGRTIDLLSIGLVADDGRELYLCNSEWDRTSDPRRAKPLVWVLEHVVPYLGAHSPEGDIPWRSRADIRDAVEAFIGAQRDAPTSSNVADVNVGTGDVLVDADAFMHAVAKADGVAGSAGLAVGVMLPTAKVTGRTSAYIRDRVELVARNVDVFAGTDSDPVVYLAEATSFRMGESLVAGKLSPQPALLRFGARVSEEGGSDVPATWAGGG